ncbi:XopZ family type III secretion system effector [Xanthomonas vesicatoria]|uniref:XopZ family type III secretion system effector n=1 Tax=Xanthomonas vesicatoria TaxID=56460 RepID=UPI002B4BA223|nr:XopZ family type III secretion system effector [Xanthomonas vesicatoria]
MTRIRPSTLTFGLPGNSHGAAHAGTPSTHKQAHHRLHQLDGLGAESEARAAEMDVGARVRRYIAATGPADTGQDTPAPPKAGRLRRVKQSLQKLARFAGTAVGLARHTTPDHMRLLRYQGTPAQPAPTAAAGPGDWHALAPLQAAKFSTSQRLNDARIAVRKAAALERLVLLHIDRLEQATGLHAKRAPRLADRANETRKRHQVLTTWNQLLRHHIANCSERLARTEQQLQQRLDQLTATPAPATGDRRPRLGDLLKHEAELDRIRALHEDARRLSARREKQQAWLQRLEASAASLHTTLAQALRSAHIVAGDLFETAEHADALHALLPPLSGLTRSLERELDSAVADDLRAGQALRAASDALIAAQIAHTASSASDVAAADALRKRLSTWASGLSTVRFGEQTVPAAGVVAIALAALRSAVAGVPGDNRADEASLLLATFEHVRRSTWSALIPADPERPDAQQDATMGEQSVPRAAIEAATIHWLDTLARVPRGRQVLGHLIQARHERAAAPARQDIARIALRADTLLRAAPGDDATTRRWLRGARRAAGAALHAADPAQALRDCSSDERAAYHALRNGYESRAPGSAYARANAHLQAFGDAVRTATSPQPANARTPNPLHALSEGLEVGSATALPTPRRRANLMLEHASVALIGYLSALHAARPQGWVPSQAELNWRAAAELLQWVDEDVDRSCVVFDAATLARITERAAALHAHHQAQASQRPGAAVIQAAPPAGLEHVWQQLQSGRCTAPAALDLVRSCLRVARAEHAEHLAQRQPDDASPHDALWLAHADECLAHFDTAMDKSLQLVKQTGANALAHHEALLDLLRDMLSHLEWRDRWRITCQRTRGANLAPLSAAAAIAGSAFGMGTRLIASMQCNRDASLEFYMGRTGLYLQISRQSATQRQLGAGLTAGYGIDVGSDYAAVGVAAAADWRYRREVGVEDGLQLRIPRLGKGREPELLQAFLNMLEHLVRQATSHPAEQPQGADWMQRLLAEHPDASVGLIDQAARVSQGTECSASISAGLRAGDAHGRRAGVSLGLGVRSRQDLGWTSTTVAGYMTTQYVDATAAHRVEAAARLTAGVQVALAQHRSEGSSPTPVASTTASAIDAGYAAEVSANIATAFCTLFQFGGEIDPVRSDRATDFSQFAAFERLVRSQWERWADYGLVKLGNDVDRTLQPVLAELQLEHFMQQAKRFADGNALAALFADEALRSEAAPLLDVHRALALMAEHAGDHARALAERTAFDALLQQRAVWEPTLLLVREKAKLTEECGVDFIVKRQRNRIAEAMRTVGQWPAYEAVPRAAGSAPFDRT